MANYCEIFQKRSSLIFYIIGSAIVLGLGYFYMHNAIELSDQCNPIRGCCFEDPLLYYLVGKSLIGYFGLCIFVFTFMLLSPYRLFYLNDDGFWTKDYGFVKWEQVTKLYMDNIAYQTAIFFNVKDNTQLKLTLFKKIVRLFRKGDLYIELSSGFDEVNEVFKLMKPHCHIPMEMK
jgi:hypothetical protein